MSPGRSIMVVSYPAHRTPAQAFTTTARHALDRFVGKIPESVAARDEKHMISTDPTDHRDRPY